MRKYFGYVRVSTQKQGEKGSSLVEQRSAIVEYAKRQNIEIVEWFEEQETAAKVGRTCFRQMLTRIARKQAHGIVLHKIDRGARNLKDWSELAALMDRGIDVHFAHESLDMTTRGGRLSADIQAVVAADFIRNLRDEVKKGMYGRLKQGLYPFRAPLGYVDTGRGMVKTVHPTQGKLIQKAFSLYATGEYSVKALLPAISALGLRNSAGRPLTLGGLTKILSCPFYYGLIVVNGESFVGKHEPLVSKKVFDQVKAIRTGKSAKQSLRKRTKRGYIFQRMITCSKCTYGLYPELQKGHTYYRCHKETCKGTSLSERSIYKHISDDLIRMGIDPDFMQFLERLLSSHVKSTQTTKKEALRDLTLLLTTLNTKLEKLTDAYLDDALTRGEYDDRKRRLLDEQFGIQGKIKDLATDEVLHEARRKKFIALTPRITHLNESQSEEELRKLLKLAISNFSVNQKSIEITWSKPYQVIRSRAILLKSEPNDTTSRTDIQCEDISNSVDAVEKLLTAIDNFSELDDFEIF